MTLMINHKETQSNCNITVNDSISTTITNQTIIRNQKESQKIRTMNCNNTKKYAMKFMIGTKIIKKFNDVPYEGQIIGYDGKYYCVHYASNNNIKDMTQSQVQRHLKNRQPRRCKRYTFSGKRYRQKTLLGEILQEKDSEAYGHNYPQRNRPNCSLITYQNIGKQDQSYNTQRSKDVARVFKASQASVALYAETGLNESQLCGHDKFYSRMTRHAPLSYSLHSYNKHKANMGSLWRHGNNSRCHRQST